MSLATNARLRGIGEMKFTNFFHVDTVSPSLSGAVKKIGGSSVGFRDTKGKSFGYFGAIL
jgi:hypothetical protein